MDSYWFRRGFIDIAREKFYQGPDLVNDLEPLKMKHMSAQFVFMTAGLFFALFVFCVEQKY